ncbi:hypothetical protein RF11_14512 [Thelohanellus kitauei]|uniref:Uncharacterized protein n=1 Tax=Thelohanellus kitauei TaxID=669202 RepID=A0A0C2N7X4_THEKT|nr:hypothetical protein RF11_14512 [Thelohanellus kitauei]
METKRYSRSTEGRYTSQTVSSVSSNIIDNTLTKRSSTTEMNGLKNSFHSSSSTLPASSGFTNTIITGFSTQSSIAMERVFGSYFNGSYSNTIVSTVSSNINDKTFNNHSSISENKGSGIKKDTRSPNQSVTSPITNLINPNQTSKNKGNISTELAWTILMIFIALATSFFFCALFNRNTESSDTRSTEYI